MLYKRAKGSDSHYWVRFRVRGVEVRRSTGTADKNAAEDYERRLRDDAWRASKLGVVRRSWGEATERWLRERATTKRSIDRDREAFAAVAPILNGASLDELTKASLSKLRQVLELPDDEGKVRKPATVLRILAAVRAVLNACVTWDWLTDAPHVDVPKLPKASEPRHLSAAQFEKLYRELPSHLQPMARFSIETGQRYAAVAKLQWSQVDLKRRHAYISSSTSKSKRPIAMPLSAAALAVLKAQVGKHPQYVFAYQKPSRDGSGDWIAPIGSVKTAWLKAAKRAGLDGFRWHDLRHSWASRHTQNGTPPIVLRDLAGWASLAMVERYSHLAPSHLAQWVEAGRGRAAKAGTKVGTGGARK
ncbi:MAG TPA: site-specific integrase [Steroidobacteraceae bacterium]|jgi:integrase